MWVSISANFKVLRPCANAGLRAKHSRSERNRPVRRDKPRKCRPSVTNFRMERSEGSSTRIYVPEVMGIFHLNGMDPGIEGRVWQIEG